MTSMEEREEPTFERYRVLAKIRSGPITDLFRAEQKALGRPVLIKALGRGILPSSPFAAALEREASLLTELDHPNVIRVLDFVREKTSMWLVLEHVDGFTLEDLVGKKKLSPAGAIAIALEIALGLEHAHAHGIVHRDVQPHNVLVSTGGDVKLVNFGAATDARLPTAPELLEGRTGFGTPAYMSPEQCRGAGAVDHRTDIYALGCVMFHLLCGRPPFIAPTPGEMIVSQVTEPPPPPSQFVPTLSPELDRLVLKCLAKDPEQRYASMTELVRACAQFTGENLAVPTIPPLREGERRPTGPSPAIEPPMAPRPPPSPPILIVAPEPPRPASRLPFALLSIALLAALVLAIIAAR